MWQVPHKESRGPDSGCFHTSDAAIQFLQSSEKQWTSEEDLEVIKGNWDLNQLPACSSFTVWAAVGLPFCWHQGACCFSALGCLVLAIELLGSGEGISLLSFLQAIDVQQFIHLYHGSQLHVRANVSAARTLTCHGCCCMVKFFVVNAGCIRRQHSKLNEVRSILNKL